MLRFFILSFVVSAVTGFVILRWPRLHSHFSGDQATAGSHKVHGGDIPRIGGVGIFLGWLVGIIAAGLAGKSMGSATSYYSVAVWIFAVTPVFAFGLAEDLTKRVGPGLRLGASFISAGIAYILLDAAIFRLDIPGVDQLLAIPLLSFTVTLIAVGGVAHSINIIDGLNGLAASVCMMAFLGLGYVSYHVGDFEILLLCGLGFGALLGFNIWNFPSGHIFCGDGGAYFLGVYLAILSVLLVSRHDQVSAWFPLLLVLYPVWETLFSAWRRKVYSHSAASRPDRLHLHTLVYRRVKKGFHNGISGMPSRRNSDASRLVIIMASANTIPAVLWWNETGMLLATAGVFVVLYLLLYKKLIALRFARHRVSLTGVAPD